MGGKNLTGLTGAGHRSNQAFKGEKKIPRSTFVNVLLETAKWMAAFILGAAGAAVQVPWLCLTSAIFEE